jgi:hypothetical protein
MTEQLLAHRGAQGLPLLPVTHDFLALVERETGYPVRLVEEPKQPALARVQLARAGAPAHVVTYRPVRDESVDYLICHQCGFVLRLFDNPPGARYEYAQAEKGRREVRRLVTEPGSKLAKHRLGAKQLEQMAVVLLENLTSLLRSIPIGLRVGEWIYDNHSDLRSSQRAAVVKEVTEAHATLEAQVRDKTPVLIFDATQALNAAQAMFWAEKYDMRELASPFRVAGYKRAGRALLDEWNEAPDDPGHDRALVDRWAEELHIAGWGAWQPYVAP